MDDLVLRLSTGIHPVEATRIKNSCILLKESIDRGYVHITFTTTETELGCKINLDRCRFEDADFSKATGIIHLEGGLTLNYEKVKLITDIDLTTLKGTGFLETVDHAEYQLIMADDKS